MDNRPTITLIELEPPSSTIREPLCGRHIPALDGIRGIAILMVMGRHWTTILDSPNPLDRAFGSIAGGGWVGVELFFVLSGFLITGILLDSRGKKHFFLDFYARRTVRIFPLYYAFLFFFLVVAKHLPIQAGDNFATLKVGQPSTWWYWAYLSNFAIAKVGFIFVLGVTWSLAIEEQFYWVWPVVVVFLGRESLIKLCWALVGLSILIRAVMSVAAVPYPAVYVYTFSHLDGLLVGAMIACYARGAGGLLALRKPALIAGIVGILIVSIATSFAWRSGSTLRENAWTQVFIYTALAAVAGTILVHAAVATPTSYSGRFLGNPILRRFGKYSYAIYLLNQPVVAIYRFLTKSHRWPTVLGSHLPEQLAKYLICTVIVYIIAWISWHCFEMWFLKLKKFFPSAAAYPNA